MPAAANAADDQASLPPMSYSASCVASSPADTLAFEASRSRAGAFLTRRSPRGASLDARDRTPRRDHRARLNVPIPRATPKTTSVDFAPGGSFYLSTFSPLAFADSPFVTFLLSIVASRVPRHGPCQEGRPLRERHHRHRRGCLPRARQPRQRVRVQLPGTSSSSPSSARRTSTFRAHQHRGRLRGVPQPPATSPSSSLVVFPTRRNQGGGGKMPGGMGGPGGNNPMAFGKSKAKFQMEPNTGVTFDDAGRDEAKNDFGGCRVPQARALHQRRCQDPQGCAPRRSPRYR